MLELDTELNLETMFVLKCRKTKRYAREFHRNIRDGHWAFTTNINEAKTYPNLDSIPHQDDYVVGTEWDPKLRVHISYYRHEFDIVELEVREKRTFNNVRKR